MLDHIREPYDCILLLDDDMVLLPGAIAAILAAAEEAGTFGFIQGTKLELDATREYSNDINIMNRQLEGTLTRIYFGDAAFCSFARMLWRMSGGTSSRASGKKTWQART